VRIAVDAMGGDRAPEATVEGAARASALPGYQILLVGARRALEPLLGRFRLNTAALRIVDAAEVIEMGEPPAQAVRRKKNASLVVCGDLVKNGEADAFVSAGNTGAGMVVAKLKLGTIRGIDRPAIASVLPSRSGRVVLLDAGATVDCSPLNLQQFGIMGSVYAEQVLGIERPRVGLLNNGEEECKGNELTRDAYQLLQDAPIRFVGNVEGRDIFRGAVDVVVCDGFVGNTVLKVGEGVAEFFRDLVREELRARPWMKIPAAMLGPVLRRIAQRTNYEEVGGAQLLGVDGVCIISHGRSNARAVANAIRAAGEAVKHGVVERIEGQIAPAPVREALV
jgi:glycerol-3-phosphate acyltransferase PlsX